MSHFGSRLQQVKQYFAKLVKVLFGFLLETPSDPQNIEGCKTYPDQFASTWDSVNPLRFQIGVPAMYVPSPEMEAEIARQNTCATDQQFSCFLKKQRLGYLVLPPLMDLAELIFYRPSIGEKTYVQYLSFLCATDTKE